MNYILSVPLQKTPITEEKTENGQAQRTGGFMTIQQIEYVLAVAESRSINSASKTLYISQSRLSGAIRDLEQEIGVTIFERTNRGIRATPEGEEFLGYARQVKDQFLLMEDRYLRTEKRRSRFSVSMQHYTFAVQAFIRTVRTCGGNQQCQYLEERIGHSLSKRFQQECSDKTLQ